MSPYDDLRIGDADREQAQTTLADHYAAGRLDHDEYNQRLDQVWAARTRAELDPVFGDLPGPGGSAGPAGTAAYAWSTPGSRRTSPVSRPRGLRLPGRVPGPLLVLLVVLGVLAVITHLPWILIGLAVWFFFLRGSGCHGRAVHTRRW